MTSVIRHVSLAAVLLVSSSAHAHIKLLKPATWVTTDATGNPQKAGPCGVMGTSGTPTNMVTTFTAGETITVEWKETVDHPGHFRIALAKDRADLKDPMLNEDASCNYADGAVPTEPHDNVLLDNLFPTKMYGGTTMFTQQVTLPNEPCEKCTLQIMQFMTQHPRSCFYYQCADIKIVAANAGGAGSAAGSSGAAVGGSGGGVGAAGQAAGGAGALAAGSGGAGASGGAGKVASAAGASATAGVAGTPGSGGMPATAVGGSAGASAPSAPAAASASGCAVAAPGAARSGSAGLVLAALSAWVLVRRRLRVVRGQGR
jgi:hypothetical protein